MVRLRSGYHFWYLDQLILHRDLPSDQELRYSRYHSKFVLGKRTSIQIEHSGAKLKQLGNLAGCLIAALFGDRLGRKNTLRLGAFWSTVGAILQFSSFHFPQLIVGRVINGLGNGLISSTCGMYQAECSRGPRRGKLSVIVVLHNVVFYCIASWLTLGCSYINSSAQWRLPMALQVNLMQANI